MDGERSNVESGRRNKHQQRRSFDVGRVSTHDKRQPQLQPHGHTTRTHEQKRTAKQAARARARSAPGAEHDDATGRPQRPSVDRLAPRRGPHRQGAPRVLAVRQEAPACVTSHLPTYLPTYLPSSFHLVPPRIRLLLYLSSRPLLFVTANFCNVALSNACINNRARWKAHQHTYVLYSMWWGLYAHDESFRR